MRNGTYLPEAVGGFPGLSDQAALHAEVAGLRTQLAGATEQMATERELAADVHRARSIAIVNNPTLALVFDIENTDTSRAADVTTDDMLSSAFTRQADVPELPEGFLKNMAKRLRIDLHPDKGHDATKASAAAKHLERAKTDPVYSIAGAMLAASTSETATAQELRDERYRLSIALSGSKPRFEDIDEAKAHAEAEVNGTEWRVRTQAAFMSFELIIGDGDIWNRFLQGIARENHMPTINMVNRCQPAIMAIQERIIKGDPKELTPVDIKYVDGVLERIWTTLKKDDNSLLPYSPPYVNWLDVLLPALQRLDPGKKPGEEYTHFEPPFQVQRAPERRYPDYNGFGQDVGKSLFDQTINDYKEDLYRRKKYNNENIYKNDY